MPVSFHFPPPPADNDNLPLLTDGWTPWSGLVACRQAVEDLLAEHRRSGLLVRDRAARIRLAQLRGAEACLRWWFFRRR